MNKKVEEIENRVNQADAKVKARNSILKKNTSDTRKKLADLNAKLPDITDPAEYEKTVKEIEEADIHLDYLVNNAPKVPNRAFTDEEYNFIMSNLDAELAKLKDERAPELLAAVKKAAVLMTRYVKDAETITNVMDHASYLHKGRVGSLNSHSKDTDISKVYADDKKLMEAFCWNYFMNVDVFSKYKE